MNTVRIGLVGPGNIGSSRAPQVKAFKTDVALMASGLIDAILVAAPFGK